MADTFDLLIFFWSQFIFINSNFFLVLVLEELMSQSSQNSSELSIAELHSVASQPSLHLFQHASGSRLHLPEPSPSLHQSPRKQLHHCHSPLLHYDPAPIQNSPWKESSLDQPYQKQKKSYSSSTSSRYVNIKDFLMGV